MMKKYVRPGMNIEEFMTEDTIMLSGGGNDTGTAPGFGDGGGDTPKMPWET